MANLSNDNVYQLHIRLAYIEPPIWRRIAVSAKSAAVSMSFKGQQAAKGMQFVTVTLKVDNPTSQDFRGYWGDYIRLKSGTITSPPSNDSTLPLTFVAGSSGGTGDVIFAMPAGSTTYTLIFLGTPSYPNGTTVNFQTA